MTRRSVAVLQLLSLLVVVWLSLTKARSLNCTVESSLCDGEDDDEVNGDTTSKGTSFQAAAETDRPNVLFIMADQFRFDAIRIVQESMKEYRGKFKIQTPNIDDLARRGVMFLKAYCVAPTCAPARTSLRTGCTMQRTGIDSNDAVISARYSNNALKKQQVESLESFDAVLAEKQGYWVEEYGKWHMPLTLFYSSDKKRRVVQINSFDFERNEPIFDEGALQISSMYKKAIKYMVKRDKFEPGSCRGGWARNPYTGFCYKPFSLDKNNGDTRRNEKRKGADGLKILGEDELGAQYSTTSVVGEVAVRAIERIVRERKEPFLLSVSFGSPHPPLVASAEYLDVYMEHRSELYIPENLRDKLRNTPYEGSKQVGVFDEPDTLCEVIAVYYALVTEVDEWVGRIMGKLDELGIRNNTMVMFTSDHGDNMGAHGMIGKSGLLEEETRIPLIISYPDGIPERTKVRQPVSAIDLFATILDYTGASQYDKSDGVSLRRFMERRNKSAYQSNGVVVVELEKRKPLENGKLSGELGDIPNLMATDGRFKLIMPRNANSPIVDIFFDNQEDPYEQNNLLGENAKRLSSGKIGKVEYMKAMMIEWMQSNDGEGRYFSDPKWNAGEGRGDIEEIRLRRTWPEVDLWVDKRYLRFGNPSQEPGKHRQNKSLYIGHATAGTLEVKSIAVRGNASKYFSVSTRSVALERNDFVRILVRFRSEPQEPISSFNGTFIEIRYGDNERVKVFLLGRSDDKNEIRRNHYK